MSTAFSRTFRSLRADGFAPPAAGLAVAACLAGAWGCWSLLAQVTRHEVSASARLEAEQAATPLQSPLAGRVQSTHLSIGREVKAGDLLVELDTSVEQLQLSEERARLAALGPQLRALNEQAAAEEEARSASHAASAQVREAEAPARFAAADEERMRQLRAEGLIPEREYQRQNADMQRARAAADTQRLGARHKNRAARLKSLTAGMSRIEAQIAGIEASIARLTYEIERRSVRAPVSGRLSEAAVLPAGAMVRAGDKLAVIVSSRNLGGIAQFAQPIAMGRTPAPRCCRRRFS